MLGITFSAEAEPSAAERISDCFQYFESRHVIQQRFALKAEVLHPKEERMERCKQIIRDSLEVVAARCRAKKVRFDLDELLRDLFPEEEASMTQEKK